MANVATGTTTSQAAGAAPGKRKRDDQVQAAKEDESKVVKRKYGLDFDILECPICAESFSPPVYQCSNGHTMCVVCCKKLKGKKCPTCAQPTGTIRCMAIEKILDSLLVSCKYAEQGCKEMLKQADIRKHKKEDCKFDPFWCPVRDCAFQGSEITLPAHMTEEHRVPTITLNRICGAGFVMNTSNSFVIVKGDKESGSKLAYVVHHMVHKRLGDMFFCTALVGSCRRVNLRVAYSCFPLVCVSISGARADDLCCMDEYWNHQFLMLPFMMRPDPSNAILPCEVHFNVASEEDGDDKDGGRASSLITPQKGAGARLPDPELCPALLGTNGATKLWRRLPTREASLSNPSLAQADPSSSGLPIPTWRPVISPARLSASRWSAENGFGTEN